jgi:hypothetical protein
MARSIPSPWPSTHVGSTSEAELDRLCNSDTLGCRYAQSLEGSEEPTLDECVSLVEPARQEVEAHRSTFNYSGNPPHKISSDAARWCAQNRSSVLLSVAVPRASGEPPATREPPAVTFHGGSLAGCDNELPAIYENNGKPKIDGNFFKSMAKSIKANRANRALIADEACTQQHTGYYTYSKKSESTPFQYWIEGDAMRMRIELKFRLIRERMLAAEASNNRSLCR